MLFKLSDKHEYMYKYMIGFLFLNLAIYSDIHYSISDKMLKYFKYLKFLCLIIITYISSLDISSGILLATAFVLFDNIINVKKYLRELFINYFESFTDSFRLTNNEIKEVKENCEQEKWEGGNCEKLKKNIKDICHQNDPMKEISFGEEEEKIILNCPKVVKTF